jgi:hypothetical protein
MAYKGHHGKIYFSFAVNAFQIPLTTCFGKLNGSQVKVKLRSVSCLNVIFMRRISWCAFFKLASAISTELLALYPGSNILVAGKEDFESQNR